MVGEIQHFLDNYEDDYVCGLIIARSVLNNENPDTKTSRMIASIMNHKIHGWKKSGYHTFKEIGRQKCYMRMPDFQKCEESAFE